MTWKTAEIAAESEKIQLFVIFYVLYLRRMPAVNRLEFPLMYAIILQKSIGEGRRTAC